MTPAPLYVGCPVWASAAWVGKLFTADAPRRDWLRQYSSAFNTVEGNSTFYALPTAAAVRRWAETARPGFRFVLKFPRVISHEKQLVDAEAETEAFLDVLQVLRAAERLGPTFLQLPPTFGAGQFPVLADYLRDLPRAWPWAVEVRHPDYFDGGPHEQALDQRLQALGIDRVLFDSRPLFAAPPSDAAEEEAQRRKPRPPLRRTVTGRRPLLRLIGRNDVAQVQPWCAEWAAVVAEWLAQGRTPYVFTHTPDDRFAPDLARLFHQELVRRVPDLPPLPAWPAEVAARAPQQRRLFE